jgi:hypothetical protein
MRSERGVSDEAVVYSHAVARIRTRRNYRDGPLRSCTGLLAVAHIRSHPLVHIHTHRKRALAVVRIR